MRGFKSFAKYTEIAFGPDFNCVLGPNGSGKSNVLDAICFVLGKSSAKSLRAEKSSNLIYNGGKFKKPAKQGEVSIYFDNSNKKFPTDDTEIKITRIVKQNGQSIYKINDKVRTRQEIIDLLGFAKINPDGYNIILQGDITYFVEMPPIERRMLIEEISGISVYEEKKKKALSQLEKVEERLKEAEIVLAERNTYLKELKKDRDQAKKFKEMSDKINQSKASLLKIQIEKKEKEKSKLYEELERNKENLNKINQEINELREKNVKKKSEIERISKEIEEKGEIEQVALNREIEGLKIGLTKKQSRLETLDNEIRKINQRKIDLDNSLKESDKKIDALTKEKEKLENKKEQLEKEMEELSLKISAFRDKNKLMDLANIEKEIEETDKVAEEIQKEIHSLREKQHNLIRQKDLVEHRISTIDEQIKKIEEVEKEHREEINSLKKKKEEFKSITLELNKCLNEDSYLAVEIDNLKKKLNQFKDELAKLEAKHTTIKEMIKSDLAVKKILEQKKPGVYGTIAELGKVNSKYSLALEIAAGQRLKSIVVENEKIAIDLIKYLKQNKLGVATFLPLNKVKAETSSEVKKLSDARGCYGLAIDLIDFDKKFRSVFEYVFANTLVVDNVDVIKRLGVGKAKMVTLDGDIAEFSGVIHGGFRKKRPGFGFSEKKLSRDIDELCVKIKDFEKKLSLLEKRREENEEKITRLRNSKSNLEGEIIKLERSLHLEPTDLDVSKKKKEELLNEASNLDKEIKLLTEKISNKNKELTSNRIKKQELKNKIAELRDPTLLAELATFEERRNKLNSEITRIIGELRSIDVQINDIIVPEKEKIKKIKKQISKEEEEFRKEIAFIKKDIEKKQDELKKKEIIMRDFHSKFKALFERRNKISDEITNNENLILKKIDESRKIEIKVNTLTLKHAEKSSELAGLQQEFKQYEGVQLFTDKTEEQLRYEISKFEKMKNEIGAVNMRALEIYEEVEKEYNSLLEKKDKLKKEKDDILRMMEEIEGKKRDLFMETFEVINNNFKKIFSQLATKGEANLDLENKQNPFEGGLDIKVRISGHKFLDIRSLSGGEKTLTALAFIFAIQEHEPASFYVFDEVDAALDKRNSEKFAKLIRKYSERAQYIIISHNDGVISEASCLYGVSMDENGVSKVVSLKV